MVWQNSNFDKDGLAFYYVCVLEIPTKVHMVTQERAYTSPIWYTPEGR